MSDLAVPLGSMSSCAPQNRPQDPSQPNVESAQQLNAKRRKKGKERSIVCNHLTKDVVNTETATCNHCNTSMSCGTKMGTTTMLRHLELRCPEFKLVRKKTKSPRSEYVFDQEMCRKSFVVVVIKHNYPFQMVEHKYFLDFMKKASPDLKLGYRDTLRKHVIDLHEEEKVNLREILEAHNGRVSLTTDVWTSDHSGTPYYCVTIYFIDSSWVLRKKIIAFKKIPYPHTGQALFEVMTEVIQDWNIEKKLGSVMVDNASSNDSMIGKMKGWFYEDLHLNGNLLHVRCSAYYSC